MELGVVDDAHGAEVDESPDARVARRGDHRARALGVDEAERRAAVEVPRDRGEVHDRVRPGEGRRERLGPRHVARAHLESLALARIEPPRDDRARVVAAHEGDDRMARVEQGGHDVAADEAVRAGDEDRGHGSLPVKCATCS